MRRWHAITLETPRTPAILIQLKKVVLVLKQLLLFFDIHIIIYVYIYHSQSALLLFTNNICVLHDY